MRRSLLLRWSLRDLRGRWALVTAIALIMAIGTALFTGLGSMETWRKRSNDASYQLLRAHDVKVALSEGSFVGQGRLRRALSATPGGGSQRAEERLTTPVQLAARGARGEVIASGLRRWRRAAGGHGFARAGRADVGRRAGLGRARAGLRQGQRPAELGRAADRRRQAGALGRHRKRPRALPRPPARRR